MRKQTETTKEKNKKTKAGNLSRDLTCSVAVDFQPLDKEVRIFSLINDTQLQKQQREIKQLVYAQGLNL